MWGFGQQRARTHLLVMMATRNKSETCYSDEPGCINSGTFGSDSEYAHRFECSEFGHSLMFRAFLIESGFLMSEAFGNESDEPFSMLNISDSFFVMLAKASANPSNFSDMTLTYSECFSSEISHTFRGVS